MEVNQLDESKIIDLENLKKLQIAILDNVVKFCDENNIKYWLDCGTLLGAVRHKGYIPWDDDIDIGMLREDYDKFMRLYNENNSRYKFFSYENNKNFLYPYGKVLDTSTILFEPDENGNKLSVNIDVFVYDNAPDNNFWAEFMFKRRDLFNTLRWVKISLHPHGNIIKKIICIIVIGILKIFPKGYFTKKLINNSKLFIRKDTSRVGNFTSVSKVMANKEIMEKFNECEFEGKMYKIPIGYDIWLKEFYGDYMKLPPKEKQISHHKFKAYYK